MKSSIIALCMFFLVSAAHAQKSSANLSGTHIELGLNAGLPVNNAENVAAELGLDLLASFAIASQVALTVDAGYSTLLAKSGYGSKSIGLIPLRAGIRFYPSEKLFITAKGGIGIITADGNSESGAAYSFGAGYFVSPKVNLGLTYDGYSKNGSFGFANLRLGYQFGN